MKNMGLLTQGRLLTSGPRADKKGGELENSICLFNKSVKILNFK